MSLAETIYRHSLNLPEPIAKEALDFIVFWNSVTALAKKPKRPTIPKPFLLRLPAA